MESALREGLACLLVTLAAPTGSRSERIEATREAFERGGLSADQITTIFQSGLSLGTLDSTEVPS